ncbi:MAG: DUF3788 domain-containing protein [Bacteroidetes bacterium]|nr:DUF3788 domain-containing protein [Bacteroidota bacterium]MBU2507327.1 DUF3788 domain-containing protein [Bacteroidota bacterium]
MEQPILSDKNEFPTEEIIYSHIGKSKILWRSLFEYIHENHSDFCEEWKYYNDGKSWLLKVSKKSRTIFWISVLKNSFRMTFYFNDRAEQVVINSTIADDLKEQFINGKRFNKIRGLTITFKYKKEIEFAKSLIAIKLSIK